MVFIKRCKIKGHYYLYVVSNYREKGKIRQKFHAYLGREDNLPNILKEYASLKNLTKGDLENLSYQSPVCLWNLAQELNLKELFGKKFKKKWGVDASLASLIMIINYALEHKSKHKLHEWYGQTYLKHLAKIPAKKLNSDLLYRTLDFYDEETIEELHKEIFEIAQKKFELDNAVTFYDVTALLFEGKKCNLAKRGYNPERAYQLQVNLGLAVTNDKFPIVHKVFEGNIKDVSTFDKIISLLSKTTKLESTIFIVDRGLPSKENIQKIIDAKSFFIAGMPKNASIQKIMLAIEDKQFIQIDENDSFYETTYNNHRLLIFWNQKMAKEQKEEREKRLKKIEEKMKSLKPKNYSKERFYEKIGQITGNYRKFFEIDYKYFNFKRNTSALEKAEKIDGKSATITNTNLEAKEVLHRYRERNFIEMSFKDLKLFVDIRPIRHWKERRVLAHVFFAVIAFGLRSLLELKLKRAGVKLSAQEALNKLNKVRALVAKDKILRLTGEDKETIKISDLFALNG